MGHWDKNLYILCEKIKYIFEFKIDDLNEKF